MTKEFLNCRFDWILLEDDRSEHVVVFVEIADVIDESSTFGVGAGDEARDLSLAAETAAAAKDHPVEVWPGCSCLKRTRGCS